MQPAQERQTARERARGTVRKVAENRQALIMTDAGSLTIVRQLTRPWFEIGDYVSGLPEDPGKCLLRNETNRTLLVVVVEALGVAPPMLPRTLWTD